MILFNNLNQEMPYQLLKEKYNEAIDAGQKGIEAISISSYNKKISEVDSRYVNLKFISNDEFIMTKISSKRLKAIFNYSSHFKNIDLIFKRVFK